MTIKVDYSVIFQITGHLNTTFPAAAGGILLGAGPEERDNDHIRITESFALPQQLMESSGATICGKDAQLFINAMISKLERVGGAKYVEGWYLSSSVGSLYDPQVFDNLWALQQRNPTSFLLVYDVALSRGTGNWGLRAFRLSDQFMALRAEVGTKVSTEKLLEHLVNYRNLLTELKIEVHQSSLVHKFVANYLKSHPDALSEMGKTLRVVDQKLLETQGDSAMDTMDDLNYEQGNYNYYQRQLVRERQKISTWQQKRRAENLIRQENGEKELDIEEWRTLFNLPEEPSRMENLLLSAQLDQHIVELEDLTGASGLTMLSTRFV